MSASTLLTLLPAVIGKVKSAANSKTGQTILDGATSSNTSLVEYTRDTRAEFVTLLDDELESVPYLGDILQNALSLCSAYYLQAVAVSTSVSGIKVTDRLNKINPNRGGTFLGAASGAFNNVISTESYEMGCLPNYLALEDNAKGKGDKPMAYQGAGRFGETIRSYDSMLVGKTLEVNITENGQSIIIPVVVRLILLGASPGEIVDILGLTSFENTSRERKYRFNMGQLKAIRDMIMCDDLIKLHRQTLLKEKSGFYAATLERRKANRLAAIASGEASVATASNVIIISHNTAAKLEAKLAGRLDTFKVREEIFQTTATMLLFVVNTKWEQVTLYTKSLPLPTSMSLKNIKISNKDGGDGILDALQKLMSGKAI